MRKILSILNSILREMRVHHYVKNILIFAALVCSGNMLDICHIAACLWGGAAFCAASSAIYFINDLCDREKDRLHPTKSKRPIASGQISTFCAQICIVLLIVVSIACNSAVYSEVSSLLLAGYFFMNLGYSLGLKNIPLLDTTILVSGFLIRVVYGAIICNIVVSDWLYLTVISLSFFLAFGKRRNELRTYHDATTREVLRHYPPAFLDRSMYLFLGLSNVFYALWAKDKSSVDIGSHFIWTVPLVLLITLRYCMTIEGESDGDPVEVLFHDRILIILCVAFLLVFIAMLYL